MPGKVSCFYRNQHGPVYMVRAYSATYFPFNLIQELHQLLIGKRREINNRFIATAAMAAIAISCHVIPILGTRIGNCNGKCILFLHAMELIKRINESKMKN